MLSLSNIAVHAHHGETAVALVRDVSFGIERGEAIGIVGESGCGKSVTWLAILKLLGKNISVGGSATLDDIDLVHLSPKELTGIRGKKIAMIFQDPMSALNPVHSIGRQIGESLSLHRGLNGAAAKQEAVALLQRVGVSAPDRRLEQYPHELSGGLSQRVMIAMALAGQPDILIADEPTTALDATVQAQILELLSQIRRETGMAMVLISHDLGVVAEICDSIYVMYAGRVVESGPSEQVFKRPRHPYTRGLLAAIPNFDGELKRLTSIPGVVPAPQDHIAGCSFSPRCAYAASECNAAVPHFVEVSAGHNVACLRLNDVDREVGH